MQSAAADSILVRFQSLAWKFGKVTELVYGSCFENRFVRKRNVGSNPTLSAGGMAELVYCRGLLNLRGSCKTTTTGPNPVPSVCSLIKEWRNKTQVKGRLKINKAQYSFSRRSWVLKDTQSPIDNWECTQLILRQYYRLALQLCEVMIIQ